VGLLVGWGRRGNGLLNRRRLRRRARLSGVSPVDQVVQVYSRRRCDRRCRRFLEREIWADIPDELLDKTPWLWEHPR
jgi:hypothetical protein